MGGEDAPFLKPIILFDVARLRLVHKHFLIFLPVFKSVFMLRTRRLVTATLTPRSYNTQDISSVSNKKERLFQVKYKY